MVLLAMGIVANERRLDLRHTLRSRYAPYVEQGTLHVTFVMDARLRNTTADADWNDVMLVDHVVSRAHCAHKSIGWWNNALQRVPNARYLLKTDDDAHVHVERVHAAIVALPSGVSVYGGPIGYSCFNVREQRGSCYAYGPRRAFHLKRTTCFEDDGPYPFAFGPMILMSALLVRRLSLRPFALKASALSNTEYGATHVKHHVRNESDLNMRRWEPYSANLVCRSWKDDFRYLRHF